MRWTVDKEVRSEVAICKNMEATSRASVKRNTDRYTGILCVYAETRTLKLVAEAINGRSFR